MLKDYGDLDMIQMDALKEIGNIGTGNAATSLASMLMKSVNIQVPKVNFLDYNDVTERLGGPETMMVGILLALSEDVNGVIMFLLEKDFAHMALNALLGADLPEFSNTMDEMGESALREIGNIMAASYVNAIAQLTDMNINISVPDICLDMVGAILSVPAIYFANISDKIMFIENEFNSGDDKVKSHILLMPDVESLAKILQKLGVIT